MGTGYTRADTGNNIADGNIINAADLDGEFDALQSAFNETTGHTHDGTSAEGAPITFTGPAQEYVSTATELRPKANNTYDLGSATNQWKDLYVDGTANIDSLAADAGTVGGANITTVSNTQTLTNKTVNLTDNTLIATSAQLAGSLTDETGTGSVVFSNSPTLTGTPAGPTAAAGTNTTQLATTAHVFAERTNSATLTNKTLTSPDINTPDIDGGTIDGTVIGGSTPAAISGTTGSFSGNLTVDTNTLFVDAANNRVGIVTSSPATQLEVVGTIRASGPGPRLSILDTGGATNEKEWGINGADGPLRIQAINDAGAGGGDLIEITRVGNSTRSIRGFRSAVQSYDLSNYDRSLIFSGGVSTIGTATAHDLVVDTNNSEAMRITSAGLVGIGTSAPSSLLEIAANATSQTLPGIPTLRITNTDTTVIANDIVGSVEFFSKDASDPDFVTGFVRNIAQDAGVSYGLAFGTKAAPTGSNATEKVRITSAGLVGIGTSAPDSPLTVVTSGATAATVALRNTTGNAYVVLQSSDTGTTDIYFGDSIYNSGFIQYAHATDEWIQRSSGAMVFQTGGVSERLRITSAGLVGIGTSAPAAQLHVAGTTTNSGNFTASITGTTMDVTAVSTGAIAVGDIIYGVGVSPITKVTALGTGTGGVGTYTVSVSQTLTATTLYAGSGSASTIRISDIDASVLPGQPSGTIEFFGSDANVPGAGVGAYISAVAEGTVPDTALTFGARDNAGGGVDANERMRITSAGHVLIGTVSSTTDLSYAPRLKLSGSGPALYLEETDTPQAYSISTLSGSLFVRDATASSARITITSAGDVGINESVPDYKLDVNGTFGFTPGASVTPVDNGDVVFELTNDTTLTVKAKGSDGVVRSGTITLA